MGNIYLFKRIQHSIEINDINGIYLKPKQVQAFDFLLQEKDVLAGLRTENHCCINNYRFYIQRKIKETLLL